MMKKCSLVVATIALAWIAAGCRQEEVTATQTSEVVVLKDEPIVLDPFDKPFSVDGEDALRIGNGVAPPRLVSRGPRVNYPSGDRKLCFPAASIIVVVDKTGKVRETEIVSVEPVVEYVNGERRVLSPDESLALLKEREFAIKNWQYEPAIKDGQAVPVKVEGGWQMRCR